jgi:hypothetical protein
MMSWIDSWHRKISTGLHFQNGHHNTAKIQHCSISKVAFDLFFKPVVSGRFERLYNHILLYFFFFCYYFFFFGVCYFPKYAKNLEMSSLGIFFIVVRYIKFYFLLSSCVFMWWSTCKLLKEICWILNAFNQCLSPLTCWVRIPLKARCTWYNIMW